MRVKPSASSPAGALLRFMALPALALLVLGIMLGASDPASDTKTPHPQATPPSAISPNALNTAASHEGARQDSETYNQRARLLARGKVVYDKYCVGCHGVEGDGNGPAAPRLAVKARDFTRGIYKFRSTDSGSLPLETDIHRTITRGLSQVSMPAFPLIPETEKLAVIEYIKSFYPRWDAEAPERKVVDVPRAPTDLHEAKRIGRGRATYLAMGCANCHGQDGAGTHATQTEYVDAWGNKVRAFNFTRGRLKAGDDPEDIYRTFHAGLRSVMPAFGGNTLAYVSRQQVMAQMKFFFPGEADTLAAVLEEFPADGGEIGAMSPAELSERAIRNSWDLVSYVMSLRTTAVRTPPVSTNN